MQTTFLYKNKILDFALWLAEHLRAGDVVTLDGPLGAGKTTFTRFLAQAMGVSQDDITSPTFTLLNEYPEAKIPLLHSDLYRMKTDSEADDFVEELLNRQAELNAILLIEWASLSPILSNYGTIKINIDFPDSADSATTLLTNDGDPNLLRKISISSMRDQFPKWKGAQ